MGLTASGRQREAREREHSGSRSGAGEGHGSLLMLVSSQTRVNISHPLKGRTPEVIKASGAAAGSRTPAVFSIA